jgi:uncharacterized BrkB/YihY/UPF0761 family membrane protein
MTITTPTIERAFAMLHTLITFAAIIAIISLCVFIGVQISAAITYLENNNL